MIKDNTVLEKLAELEHRQWFEWAYSIIETEPTISEERKKRWEQYFVPYEDLPENVKEHDRVWARKVLDIINDI